MILFQRLFQLLRGYVALEGNLELRILGLVHRAVQSHGTAAFDMTFGRVEVGVAGYYIALFHECGEEHVLGCTALVCRNDILEARNAGNGILQFIERTCTGIGFVAHHQRSPLAVAHGARTGVGQTVDINLVGLELEHVVVRLFNPLLALCAGTFADGFNHLDFPRFCKW